MNWKWMARLLWLGCEAFKRLAEDVGALLGHRPNPNRLDQLIEALAKQENRFKALESSPSVQGVARWRKAEAVPFEQIQPGQFFIYSGNLYLKTSKIKACRFTDQFTLEDWTTRWDHAQSEIIHRVLFYLPGELGAARPPLEPPARTDCQTGL
jgi:hypothetical protein